MIAGGMSSITSYATGVCHINGYFKIKTPRFSPFLFPNLFKSGIGKSDGRVDDASIS